MRVVAGSVRGRTLVAPSGGQTRPTSDRAREALFNSLASHGDIVDAAVADLFAGSGALGIEALSRGARHCTFVEHDRAALDALRVNLARCGFEDRSTVQSGDAMRLVGGLGRLDLVVADPPYSFDRWDDLFAGLNAATVAVESDRGIDPPANWELVRSRRYGRTVMSIVRERDDIDHLGPAQGRKGVLR